MSAADVLFTGEPCSPEPANPSMARPWPSPVVASRPSCPSPRRSGLVGERPGSSQLDGALLAPASRTPTSTRSAPASSCCSATSPRPTDAADAVAPRRGVRRREPRRAVDPRRRVVDGPLPRRRPVRGAARRGRARPAGAALEPRPPQRVGEHRRHHAGRHRRVDPRSRRRPDRARGRRHPGGHLPRGRRATCSRRPPARSTDDFAYAGLLRAQEELLALGITGWQDAMVGGGSAASASRSRVPRAARRGHAARARRRCAVVGARRRPRAGRADDRRRDAVAALGGDGPLRARHDEDHGRRRRREPDRRDAHALPRRHGHDTDNSGLSFVDPAAPARSSPRWTPPACRCTSTPSATARCARRSTRVDGGARGERRDRRPPSPRPPPGRRGGRDRAFRRRSTRSPTSRRSGRRHEDQIDDLTLPFLQDGAGGAPVPVRRPRARTAPDSPPAATGRCRAPTRWTRSTSPSTGSHPGSTPSRSAARTSASTSRRRWPPTPRHRLREPPRPRHRPHPRGLPREPRRPRPGPLLASRRRRSTARRWSRPGSRATLVYSRTA